MSLIHDRDPDAAPPERARDLGRGPAAESRAREGTHGLPGPARAATSGQPVDGWRAITRAGRRGGHPVVHRSVARLQTAAGNAAVADLLAPYRGDICTTRLAGPTQHHAADVDVLGSEPGAPVRLGTDEPAEGATPLEDEGGAPVLPAPTSSSTTVGPPSASSYTVSGTLRQAAGAVAARPEAGATITTPALDIAPGGKWPTHVQVTVTQVVVLPEWDGKASATQNQRNEWDRFKAAITAHEAGHVATDVKAFANAHARIKSRKTRPEGETEFDTIATQSDTDNAAFDTRTDHGRNTGTSMNPNIDEVTKVP